MLNQNKLAQKRHRKALRRKNKKYTGPKYSRLEQLMMFFPMLEKAGIIERTAKVETGDNIPDQGFRISQHINDDSKTSFV